MTSRVSRRELEPLGICATEDVDQLAFALPPHCLLVDATQPRALLDGPQHPGPDLQRWIDVV